METETSTWLFLSDLIMKNLETVDTDGYLELSTEFNHAGFDYKREKVLDNGWQIYSQRKDDCLISFELVRVVKSEEREMGGQIIAKRWCYPGNSAWGRIGFTCVSLERAEEKYRELVIKKEQQNEPKARIIVDENAVKRPRGRPRKVV